MEKRQLQDHQRDAARRARSPRVDLTLILDRIRSLHNVGSIFRTADGFGVKKIFLGGFTPAPPRPEIAKIALGAEKSIAHESVEDPAVALLRLAEQGVSVVAIEQTTTSIPLYDFDFPPSLALILGHEVEGIDRQLLALASAHVEIPMYGAKHSHNVAVASGIVLAEVRRQWRSR